MIGYHYSNKILKEGDVIISNQHKGITFELVWNEFKKVNPELFHTFGYAYPLPFESKSNSFKYLYYVESQNVIVGNLKHSVYLTMDRLLSGPWKDKTLPVICRLELRSKFLREQAEKYFDTEYNMNPWNIQSVELISDSWVIKKVKLCK